MPNLGCFFHFKYFLKIFWPILTLTVIHHWKDMVLKNYLNWSKYKIWTSVRIQNFVNNLAKIFVLYLRPWHMGSCCSLRDRWRNSPCLLRELLKKKYQTSDGVWSFGTPPPSVNFRRIQKSTRCFQISKFFPQFL